MCTTVLWCCVALHDNLERVAFQFSKGVPDMDMGGQCALLKGPLLQRFAPLRCVIHSDLFPRVRFYQ